jgi:transposase
MEQELVGLKGQDFRSGSSEVRQAIRQRGISLIKFGKKTKGEVAVLFGVNKNTVRNWCKRYKAVGDKGLADKKRGARSEDCKLLTDAQEMQIQKLITDRYPEQYKLSYALWTSRAVRDLVEQQFGIVVSRATMCNYLKSWGFTPQKPKKKAYEQNPKLVEKWLVEEYPAIKERAVKEHVEIH